MPQLTKPAAPSSAAPAADESPSAPGTSGENHRQLFPLLPAMVLALETLSRQTRGKVAEGLPTTSVALGVGSSQVKVQSSLGPRTLVRAAAAVTVFLAGRLGTFDLDSNRNSQLKGSNVGTKSKPNHPVWPSGRWAFSFTGTCLRGLRLSSLKDSPMDECVTDCSVAHTFASGHTPILKKVFCKESLLFDPKQMN